MKQQIVYIATLFTAMLLTLVCEAQNPNLVPNPSFELYNKCPVNISNVAHSPGYNDFPTVQNWVSPLKSGSPDYYNACAPSSSYVSVPGNAFGYQSPRNGNAYVGLIAWEGRIQSGNMQTLWAEYLQCRLNQPLQAGTKYCVTFFVNTAIANATYNFVGVDKIGINFSGSKQEKLNGNTMTLGYDIVNSTGYYDDTSGWKKVTGLYTAQGGEEWMTIGWYDNGIPNFQPIKPLIPNTADNYRNYIYIDDVSVIKLDNRDTFYNVNTVTYCNPDSLPFNFSSTEELGEYQWSNGEKNRTINVRDTGTFWCVADATCRVFIDTFKLVYEPAPELSLGKELINCNNEAVEISANYPDATYQWSTGEMTDKIKVNKSGVYVLTINNECGQQTDSVHVYIQPPTPAPPAVDTTICQFVQAPVINVTGNKINWYTYENARFGIDLQPPIITREPSKYTLYITQTIGKCESDRTPVNIDVHYTPHEILGDEVVMCDNDLKMIGEHIPDIEYKWNTGASSCCVLPEKDGMYRVAMTNQCGTYVDTLWVTHTICENCIVFPNAFTPGSASNNKFKPIIKCPVEEYHIRIYNRWGNAVFESDNINDGWDGRSDYNWADIGVYVYIVEYRAVDKKRTQRIQGNVMLLH